MHDESVPAYRTAQFLEPVASFRCLPLEGLTFQIVPLPAHSFVDMVGRPRRVSLKEGEVRADKVASMLLEYGVLEGSQLLRARRYEIFIHCGLPLLGDDEDPAWPRPSGYGTIQPPPDPDA